MTIYSDNGGNHFLSRQYNVVTGYKRIKDNIPDNVFFSFALPSVAYGKSRVIDEISNAKKANPEIKTFGLTTAGLDNYLFDYVDKNELKIATTAYDRGKCSGNPLMDYELTAVLDENSNTLLILKLDDTVKDFEMFHVTDIEPARRAEIFEYIKALAKDGVIVDPNSLFFNKNKDSAKILLLSLVSVNGFDTPDDRNKYLEFYKDYLKLQKETD